MRIQELIAFVTRSLNYIAVVTRVNVARNPHKQTREIRFCDWLAYCYIELSHLRPIEISNFDRACIFLYWPSPVRTRVMFVYLSLSLSSLLQVIERDFCPVKEKYLAQNMMPCLDTYNMARACKK